MLAPELAPRVARNAPAPTAVRALAQILALALIGLSTGCSGIDVLNALVPRAGYTVTSDIAYGPDPRHRLDVYRPDSLAEPPAVVVFFHGGRWQEGAKEQYRFVAQGLAARGLITVVPNYRLYPAVRFPAFVHDAALAVHWVHDHAAELGGDARQLFLMGHSAGAHIAALVALDERYLRAAGDSQVPLAGVIGLAGPYDFLPLTDADLQDIFGPPERYPESQPVRFVRGGAPPFQLLYGCDDDTVKPHNIANLARRLRSHGDTVQTVLYEDLDHIGIVAALAQPLRFLAPVLDDTTQFVSRVANGGALRSSIERCEAFGIGGPG